MLTRVLGLVTSNIVKVSRLSMCTYKLTPLEGANLNYVDGERQSATGQQSLSLIEPATGEVVLQGQVSSAEDVANAVTAARSAFPLWSQLSGFERGKILRKTADLIRANVEDLIVEESKFNGKPLYEARFDIDGCADTFEYYGGLATTVHGSHIPLNGDNDFAYTRREALGVIGGIGAWNYPLQTASWKMAPALACGNTLVYKPSPLAAVTPLHLAEILRAAGVPKGTVNVVQGEASTGEALCAHPGVNKISFTGSMETGQAIMRACATKGLKPVTLELGGKSPLIIFSDCDIDRAVLGAMLANFYTQGEVCSNASRVFVHNSIYPEFLKRFVERTKELTIGDPMVEGTKVGATICQQHMQKVINFIEEAKNQGAKIECGGERVIVEGRCKKGYFLSPCVMSNLNDSMTIVKEEVFGAVALVLPFETEEEVVCRANDTDTGLAAGLFTNNLQRAHRVARQLQAGSIFVNTYNVTPVEVPFGGFKHSGIGRECGPEALNYYTQVKSVTFDMNDKLFDPFSP